VWAIVHNTVEYLIPPASLPLLAIAGGLITMRSSGRSAGRWRQIGHLLIVIAAAGLLLLSLPVTPLLLIAPLEADLPLVAPPNHEPAAIVILGGDVLYGAHDRVTVGALTLERLRAGARLARKTGLPILVTGGPQGPGQPAVAQLMAQSLKNDFGLRATWVEPTAQNTWQNARFSDAILQRHHIDSIYVVTQAWHLRRALIAFAPLPVTVTAAPTQIDPSPALAWRDFTPAVSAWQMSYYALHEWIGCAYYLLRLW
jgi:uncharacterized SAM-binding protein YcdF (DUF218 family)